MHRSVFWLCLMATCSAGLGEIVEPEELANLRRQYLRQVERQLEQPKRVYSSELEKLQARLIAQGRLEEAVIVQKERESLAQPVTEPPDTRRPQNAGELQKAMENTAWEWVSEVPGAPDVRYVILLSDGIIIYGWNNLRGKWRATAPNRVEFEYQTANDKHTGVMRVAPDLSKWEGSWSSDAFKRSGKRVAAPAGSSR